MGGQLARRFRSNGRRLGLLLALLPVLAVVVWLALSRPWSPELATASIQPRLDSAVAALEEYQDRIAVALRLQFLEVALADGRRSSELRTDYRVVEERLDALIASLEPEVGEALESEFEGLLPDLTRDRSAARRRLAEMQELLLPDTSLARQGDDR